MLVDVTEHDVESPAIAGGGELLQRIARVEHAPIDEPGTIEIVTSPCDVRFVEFSEMHLTARADGAGEPIRRIAESGPQFEHPIRTDCPGQDLDRDTDRPA